MTFQDLAQTDVVKQDPNAISEVDLTAQAPANVEFPTVDMTEEANTLPSTAKTAESDSDDQDKKLKRKLGERAVSGSEVPMINHTEPSKRARDGDEPDQNPRDKKRPTPPPEEEVTPAGPSASTSVEEVAKAASQPKLVRSSYLKLSLHTQTKFATHRADFWRMRRLPHLPAQRVRLFSPKSHHLCPCLGPKQVLAAV